MSAIVEQPKTNSRRNKIIGWVVLLVLLALFIYSVQDWHQLWKISSAPLKSGSTSCTDQPSFWNTVLAWSQTALTADCTG